MYNSTHKFYLGGPMSGLPEYNFPAFAEAKMELKRIYEIEVISAHEVDHGVHTGAGTQPYTEYLRGDLKVMLECDALILLLGWAKSTGARFELETALTLKYPVYLWTGLELVEM